MQRILVVGICAALGGLPIANAQAQDLQETLGRILQGFQGQGAQGDTQYDQRQDPRSDPRSGDRRSVYSDRWEAQDRLRALDEADRRLDAQQRRLDEDRRRIDAERRRLAR